MEFDFAVRAGAFRLAARGAVEGGVTGLFGPSGAGKTTFLHALAGLLCIDEGTIRLDGRTLADASRGVHLPPEARRIGVVFQDGRLFPHLDVERNLRFGARAAAGAGKGAAAPAFDEVVEILDIAPLLRRIPAGLSGGERQRVALGRALLAAPRLLLLDEPLASLDRPSREAILPYLRRLPERFGIPTIHVTHDLLELLSLTERLILLDGGAVRGIGSYRDLALRPEWLGPASPLGRVNVLAGSVAAIDGRTCRVRIGAAASPAGARGAGDRALELAGVGSDLVVGARCTATIGAEEIAVATGELGTTSIQNQLRARVARRVDQGGATVLELRARGGDGEIPLLVEATTRSADRLAITEGLELTALIKASAVRVRGHP